MNLHMSMQQFNCNNYPQKSQTYCWVHKFQATGSVNNLNKKVEYPRSDRKLTARCRDNVDALRASAEWRPKKSLRRRFQELVLSRASLQRILKKNLQLYPHRIQIKHKLTSADMEFLVSVINHYHINGLHLFWDIMCIDQLYPISNTWVEVWGNRFSQCGPLFWPCTTHRNNIYNPYRLSKQYI